MKQKIRTRIICFVFLTLFFTIRVASQEFTSITVDNIAGAGQYSSIAVDLESKPHISYYYGDNSNNLKYARFDDGIWKIETVDIPGDVGKNTSIVTDIINKPSISYFYEGNNFLKLVIFENSSDYSPINPYGIGWMTEIVCFSDRWMEDISLALDNGNEPHIAYIDIAGTTAILAKAGDTDHITPDTF